MDEKYEYLFKLVILGDSGVGRRCIQTRIADDRFDETFIGIVRIEFKCKIIELEEKKIKLQIWDDFTLARRRYLYPSYFKGARGIVFVYDVTDQGSFNNIKMWLELADIFAPRNARRLLIGNKYDCTENKVVEYATAKEYADQLGIPFFEASAKNGTNVMEAFMTLAAEIKKTYVPPMPKPVEEPPEQGGILNSITASFYSFFGFGKDTSSGINNTNNEQRSTTINNDEGKSEKKIIVVSEGEETEITLADLKQMRDSESKATTLKIAGQKINILGKIP